MEFCLPCFSIAPTLQHSNTALTAYEPLPRHGGQPGTRQETEAGPIAATGRGNPPGTHHHPLQKRRAFGPKPWRGRVDHRAASRLRDTEGQVRLGREPPELRPQTAHRPEKPFSHHPHDRRLERL